jgi:hypothetical protein
MFLPIICLFGLLIASILTSKISLIILPEAAINTIDKTNNAKSNALKFKKEMD